MTQFDRMVRRGLMDANLAQYEKSLLQADSMKPDFSAHYFRERTRLLSDPWGWMRRRSAGRGKRLDWRLVAVVAALLLLSACAYAVFTGQFSQWFPRMGVDPEAPEMSENVLSRTGTVIQQSQTVGDTTVTLNAAVWDGTNVWLSIVIESPNIPEEVQRCTPLYTADCRLILRDDQWMEYTQNRLKDFYADLPPEEAEAAIQADLDKGNRSDHIWLPWPDAREENTMTLQVEDMLMSGWFTETKRPELTLHLESIAPAIYGEDGYPTPGEVFIEGPFDLTFTLEEPLLPIRYGGADVEVTTQDVPLRFTGFQVSVTELYAFYDALDPVELPQPGETVTPEEMQQIDAALIETMDAAYESMKGIWKSDGTYVDLTGKGGGGGSDSASRSLPYPMDPAAVTAVNIGGTRVELSELEVLTE